MNKGQAKPNPDPKRKDGPKQQPPKPKEAASKPSAEMSWQNLYDKPKVDPAKATPSNAASAPSQFEDEAIVSMQNEAAKPKFSNKNKKMDADSFVGQREFRPKAERTLEKADWIKDSKVSGTTIQSSLNDMDQSSYD